MNIYNSLSKKTEEFTPIIDKTVRMYVCGITPYDTTHLGHAFTYVSFDVLTRYLTYRGYYVTYTQNVTDINDRDTDILKRALQKGVSWDSLATFWTERFLKDMCKLNWIMPQHYLKASENIPAMVDLINTLLRSKIAYNVNGSVYLDITKDKDFGKLGGFTHEQMLKLAQEFEEDIHNPDKRNALDVTLWRASTKDQPKHIPSFDPNVIGVDSAFGKGRPGWHIECSAMAITSLGEQIDIHGGGKDLIFPHHESEIVQSEAATGKKPFAKYWMHTGTVLCQGEKMSKSLGNLVLISDLLQTYSANAIRFMLLSHHYRSDWEYTQQEMEKAQKVVDNVWKGLKDVQTQKTGNLIDAFVQTMDNDLNAPAVLSLIEDEKSPTPEIAGQLRYILSILGFTFTGDTFD